MTLKVMFTFITFLSRNFLKYLQIALPLILIAGRLGGSP